MEDIISTASALRNWKQRKGALRDQPTSDCKSLDVARRRLESLLAHSINCGNYRELAASAKMNSLDLIETITVKVRTLGIRGILAAISAHQDHGTVTCLQFLHSL